MKAEKFETRPTLNCRTRSASSRDQLFKLKFQLNMGQTES